MVAAAGEGHLAGALSAADIFASLYFGGVLDYRSDQPDWPDRDYLLVSNGHIAAIWYASLARAGFFDVNELNTFRQLGSKLQGHPHLQSVPGIENTSGLLGQGLSVGVGLAIGLELNHKPGHVFVHTSDGEHQEGQTWEAYMLAGARKISNLTVLIDRNKIVIDDLLKDTVEIEPLAEKIKSFGWQVEQIDGHNHQQICDACIKAKQTKQPVAIICETVAGRGVSFMENNPKWHSHRLTPEDAQKALKELGDNGS